MTEKLNGALKHIKDEAVLNWISDFLMVLLA
jgi:hypothetical protein